jgi:hypothetical protein
LKTFSKKKNPRVFLPQNYLACHTDGDEGNAAIDVAPAAQVEGEQDGDQVLSCAQHLREARHLQAAGLKAL